jgi:hypothetical protein
LVFGVYVARRLENIWEKIKNSVFVEIHWSFQREAGALGVYHQVMMPVSDSQSCDQVIGITAE